MKYKFLTGDLNWQTYGGKFISKKLNNGDFDYWLVLSVTNMHEATGDYDTEKYHVQIEAVSPQAVRENNPAQLDSAIGSCGFHDDMIKAVESDPVLQVEALSTYGIFARLWQKSGDNLNDLMREARKESDLIELMFGFYMDRPGNGIGQTGWGLIKGQDLREFFGANQ